jgi:hypothetical protein
MADRFLLHDLPTAWGAEPRSACGIRCDCENSTPVFTLDPTLGAENPSCPAPPGSAFYKEKSNEYTSNPR